jgi:glycosyltransferase involved in cell wall biosynthesis/GT2 family glycosyltransferase
MDLVSIVIPCRNPSSCLLEAVASAKAQTHEPVETILVNDGTDLPASEAVLEAASRRVDRYIEQAHHGLAAARNAGIRAASGSFVVPLDSDDLLAPEYVAECLGALRAHPEAAFVYTDYRVFGDQNYTERLPEYNLYGLLENNIVTYAALIRREDWAAAGGDDESFSQGYEDWEFWLRLAARGRFGHRLSKVLFSYRRHGRSLWDVAREHHAELAGEIQSRHPELYEYSARARIKSRWEPAVCVAGARPLAEQTIQDWERADSMRGRDLLDASRAEAFLIPSEEATDPQTVEIAALAVWGGKASLRLPDGSVAMSRQALRRQADIREVRPEESWGHREDWPSRLARLPAPFRNVRRHLVNAGLLSVQAWLKHPLRSACTLIPLRLKEGVNRRLGRRVFDLSFYLRFQPGSVLSTDSLVTPLRYFPRSQTARRRLCLITPHFGPGGAENMLLEIAGALDRSRYEILAIATQSRDARWLSRWRERADHVYDLSRLVSPDRLVAAVYSIVRNWRVDAVLVQNALAAYSAIPQLKMQMPGMRIMDLVHAVGAKWDLVSRTAEVGPYIDTRVVVSEAARDHLRRFGLEDQKIRLIRPGIDLERFRPASSHTGSGLKRVLFAGRLDPVKRPVLLPAIARALLRRRPNEDFRVVVAGDGPEDGPLRAQVRRAGVDRLFEFLGYVVDLAPVIAESELLIVPSREEGIPLVILEALACSKPVVASKVGAITEALDETSGLLIAPADGEADAFAEAIHRLLEDPGLRAEMGAAGRRKVEAEFDLRRARQAYQELFG